MDDGWRDVRVITQRDDGILLEGSRGDLVVKVEEHERIPSQNSEGVLGRVNSGQLEEVVVWAVVGSVCGFSVSEIHPEGFEHDANSPGKQVLHNRGGAKSGAPTRTNPNIAPELAALIDAWPRLPEPIKAGILALVRAASA